MLSLAEEHVDTKAIDLNDLDDMEHDAMNHLEERLLYIAETLQDKDGLKEMGKFGPKMLNVIFSDAGGWFDRRLKVKQQRGKWLGYEVKETAPMGGTVTQDNRSINITVNGETKTIKPGELRDSMNSVLGEVDPELLALVEGSPIEGIPIEGEVKELDE